MAVPHCPDCTHSLGSTLFVPQLGGRLGDTKLHVSCERVDNWIQSIGRKVANVARKFEGVPPALRVCWIAVHHSGSLAESLASIEPTWMQVVVGSVLVDGSWQPLLRRAQHLTADLHANYLDSEKDTCYVHADCFFWHTSHLLFDLDCAGSSDIVSCGLDVPPSLKGRRATRLGCCCHVPSMPS